MRAAVDGVPFVFVELDFFVIAVVEKMMTATTGEKKTNGERER